MLLRRRMVITLAALVLLIVAIACGPVAPEDALTPAAIQQPAPIPDSGAAETLTPAPKPTETPTALLPQPTKLPTLLPKPTETPTPLPPKPAPLPTLPPKPTETPLPTPFPTRDLRTPAPTLAPDLPHPEGLAGCFEMSIFVSAPTEYSDYMSWCDEQISVLVRANCQGSGDWADEVNCADRELENARSYFIRSGFYRCFAITESDARERCGAEVGGLLNDQFYGLWDAWPKVRHAANRAPAVVSALGDVVACLEALGYEQVDTGLLFQWQRFDNPDTFDQREEDYTPEQKAARSELAEPADQCARQAGYYAAQDSAWTAEVERLYQEEPETAQPLRNEGILEILQAPGVAPFLTLRQ